MIRLASYQGDLKKRYGKSVSERILAPGDLVLRKVLGSRKDPTRSFQRPDWEHSTSKEWTTNLSSDLGI